MNPTTFMYVSADWTMLPAFFDAITVQFVIIFFKKKLTVVDILYIFKLMSFNKSHAVPTVYSDIFTFAP